MNSTELPKVNVTIESEVNELFKKSKVTQEFTNNLNRPIELKVSIENNIDDIIFSSFTAKIGDSKIVQSKIVKDEKAEVKYTDAIAEGNAAIYAKKCSNGNKYIIHFGNIPSKEKIIFISEFIQNTKYKNKFEIELLRNLPVFEGLLYYENFDVNGKLEIKTQNKIIEIEKHIEDKNIEILKESYQNEEKNNYLILYKIKNKRNNGYIYEKNLKSSKILFNIEYKQPLIYYQKLSGNSDEKIYSLLYKTKIINNNIELNPGLFIFLLDQSNSMQGEPRKIACNALKIFIQSIPKNSYYQIIGFGTKFKKYNETPVLYKKSNIEKSLKIINDIKANMKGTNIYSPLDDIYKSKLIEGTINLPKAIFILTDGAIHNKTKTLELIEKNNNRFSIYSIGLGNKFDKDLIKKAGIMGKGNSYFCSDVKNLTLIISKSINDFVNSCYNNLSNIQNFKLTCSLQDKDILQNDEIPKQIDENTKICYNYLIKDKSQYDKIIINNEYNLGKEIIKKEYQITPVEIPEGNELFKLIFQKYILEKENLIKNLKEYKQEKEVDEDYYKHEQELIEFLEIENPDTVKNYNELVKKENEQIKKENELIEKENAPIIKGIIDICLKYQILSKYTSLFAKVELNDKISEELKLVTGFHKLNGNIIQEFDELNNIINSKGTKDVNQLRYLLDKFIDEYIDEIDNLPEEKINQLNSLDNQIYYLESQKEARNESKNNSLVYYKGVPLEILEDMGGVPEDKNDEEGKKLLEDFFKECMNSEEKIDNKKEKEMKQLNKKMKLKESINLKKSIKKKENDKNQAMEIIKTQDFIDGFWDINTKTEIVKKKYQKEFNTLLGLNKNNNKINNKVLMTLLVIYYIYDEYPELIDEIIMIIKKGKLFIQNTCNESYEDLIKKAGFN